VNKDQLNKLLQSVKDGSLDVPDAINKLKSMPYEDLGFAKLDHHRELRKGFPEVIFCEGKTTGQVVSIFQKLSEGGRTIIGTRADEEKYEAVKSKLSSAIYYPDARIIQVGDTPEPKSKATIAVVTGGTADMPVAEEAAVTAKTMGNQIDRLYDIGVAGMHRMLHNKQRLFDANVIIAVAGMEGALASVVGGMVSCPVIAVPTSVGYGASFNGLSALLSMLNSCAPGISVVNIDNGFGAGYMAAMINQMNGEKQK